MPKITFELDDVCAFALAQVVKRLARSDIGPGGLNLTNPHDPAERHEAERAIDTLRDALAEAGFAPR